MRGKTQKRRQEQSAGCRLLTAHQNIFELFWIFKQVTVDSSDPCRDVIAFCILLLRATH